MCLEEFTIWISREKFEPLILFSCLRGSYFASGQQMADSVTDHRACSISNAYM